MTPGWRRQQVNQNYPTKTLNDPHIGFKNVTELLLTDMLWIQVNLSVRKSELQSECSGVF